MAGLPESCNWYGLKKKECMCLSLSVCRQACYGYAEEFQSFISGCRVARSCGWSWRLSGAAGGHAAVLHLPAEDKEGLRSDPGLPKCVSQGRENSWAGMCCFSVWLCCDVSLTHTIHHTSQWHVYSMSAYVLAGCACVPTLGPCSNPSPPPPPHYIHLSVHSSIHLSVHKYICPSIHLFVRPFVHPSMHSCIPSICPSIHLCMLYAPITAPWPSHHGWRQPPVSEWWFAGGAEDDLEQASSWLWQECLLAELLQKCHCVMQRWPKCCHLINWPAGLYSCLSNYWA